MMKELIISGAQCHLVRQKSSRFFCERCHKHKVSGLQGEFEIEGIKYKICNACYGYLLSDITEGVKQVNLQLTTHPEKEDNKMPVLQNTTINEVDILREALAEAESRVVSATEEVGQLKEQLAELKRLSMFADIGSAKENNPSSIDTSICKVYHYYEKTSLWRIADVKNGEIIPYEKTDGSFNWFYWKDGPAEDDHIGQWDWYIGENGYPVCTFAKEQLFISIVEFSDCESLEEIVSRLQKKERRTLFGEKWLFVLPNSNGLRHGVLCKNSDFESINGWIQLKQSVCTLPVFTISDVDTVSLSGCKVYRYLKLGVPNSLVQIKSPLEIVKQLVLMRATKAVLRRGGLTNKEAQHCQAFLSELPTDSLLQEIVDAYGCTKEEAQGFINDFIVQSDQYLSEKDIDVAVISAALERNKELLVRCKEVLTEEWRVEHAEMLRQASDQLSAIQSDISSGKATLALLAAEQEEKCQELDRIRIEYEAQEKLADDIEKKIADRIAAARKNAAEFIAEMAFNQSYIPSSAKNNANSEVHLSSGILDCVSHEPIEDIDTFEEELAENLEIIGYEETTASEMANIISFCICHNLPVVVGENAEKIADCIAAMFGTQGAYAATVPIGGSSAILCKTMDELVHTGRKVFVLNGIFDGFSVNAFNEIHQRSLEWGNNCVLILSASGVMPEMIPVSVWNKAFFVDGDVGLVHIQTQKLNSFESNFSFEKECVVDQIKSHRKAMKPFRGTISNTAILLYSVFMATYDETIKTSLHLRLQFVLAAGGKNASEEIAEAFNASGITADENSQIARYL